MSRGRRADYSTGHTHFISITRCATGYSDDYEVMPAPPQGGEDGTLLCKLPTPLPCRYAAPGRAPYSPIPRPVWRKWPGGAPTPAPRKPLADDHHLEMAFRARGHIVTIALIYYLQVERFEFHTQFFFYRFTHHTATLSALEKFAISSASQAA